MSDGHHGDEDGEGAVLPPHEGHCAFPDGGHQLAHPLVSGIGGGDLAREDRGEEQAGHGYGERHRDVGRIHQQRYSARAVDEFGSGEVAPGGCTPRAAGVGSSPCSCAGGGRPWGPTSRGRSERRLLAFRDEEPRALEDEIDLFGLRMDVIGARIARLEDGDARHELLGPVSGDTKRNTFRRIPGSSRPSQICSLSSNGEISRTFMSPLIWLESGTGGPSYCAAVGSNRHRSLTGPLLDNMGVGPKLARSRTGNRRPAGRAQRGQGDGERAVDVDRDRLAEWGPTRAASARPPLHADAWVPASTATSRRRSAGGSWRASGARYPVGGGRRPVRNRTSQ